MNSTGGYNLTIIVPVYNEKDNMETLEARLSEFLPHCLEKACVLFVNDGSSDGSAAMIEEMCRRHDDFFYISLSGNSGLSAALKAGFDHCDSIHCAYMDADLQTDPEDFNLLLEHIGSYPMVTGIRSSRQDSIAKKMQSRLANAFRRLMTGDGAQDTCCPLKVLHTDYARRLPMFDGMHRFLPALMLLQEGGSYKQVCVSHHPRQAGESKYHLWNRLWRPFADCFAYRWMKKRYIEYKIDSEKI